MPNVLYPHHVGLMVIILVYHREPSVGGPAALHPKVRMRMLRVLAREIGEVRMVCDRHVGSLSQLRTQLDPPTPYYQLVSKLVDGFGDPSLDSELAFLSHSLNQAVRELFHLNRSQSHSFILAEGYQHSRSNGGPI